MNKAFAFSSRCFRAVATTIRVWQNALCWLLLLSSISLMGQPSAVVAPGTLANQDEAFGAGTLAAGGYRFQEVYGSQNFPTQGMIITEVRFRPDSTYGFAFTSLVANIQFNLSTTTSGAEGLSNAFDSNTGTDDTVVFSGSLLLSSQFIGPEGGPKVFDIAVPLTTPFIYNPAAGNLLLDIRNFSGSGASPLSGSGSSTDGASRLIASSITTATGPTDHGVDALQVFYFPTNLPPPPPPPPPELRLTRGPYLQSGTTSNVVVRWRTARESDTRVEFGLSSNAMAWAVSDASLTMEHIITLTNLSPDTLYFYRIGAAGTNIAGGPDYFFLTSPSTGKPTRIWAIGDAGTSTQGEYGQRPVRDAFDRFTGNRYTDIFLMLGDNAYNTGTDDEYQVAVFDMYARRLRSSILWSTIGNHDAASGAYWDIFTLPRNGEGGGIASGTEAYYSFNYGNIHFVCLDSETSSPFQGDPMLNWLEQDLAANTQDWLIAYWHEPPYSKGSHNSDAFFGGDLKLTQMRENAVPILESYGVDLVLCGHSHVFERTYLLNGHYGRSGSLVSSMILDSGSGRLEESGAYLKAATGPAANQGAVYVVGGSSGWVFPSSLDHPAMFADPAWGGTRGLNQLGSMVIDITGNRLDAKFLRETGAIDDHFTIIKGIGGASPVRLASFIASSEGGLAAQWKSISGRRYQIEQTHSLENPTWLPASPIITAAGPVTRWSGDMDLAADKYFLRVVDLGD